MRVYFCPYCAAMWASMRPLYEEHIDAGDEVYVMPLPYATKDSAGFEGKYHVDRGFPVAVIEPCSVENINADVLYFHNPYDDENRITQVDPRFFSGELKKATRELVFVPYYTMGGDLQSIILAPGVLASYKVVVWSEEQKANYLKTIKTHHGEDWEDRIIVKQRPEPKKYEIPEEWREKMTGKHVIFLNTSLNALLRERQYELQKVRTIIRQYQQDDTCILWRPHPLYEATIEAMVPGLRVQYRNLLNMFIDTGRGILDMSPHFERAVYLSSEYIGDPSSVVAFFQEQKKPVTVI